MIAGSYPDDSIYMLQHLFNHWYGNLDVDKMCAGAVMMALFVFILIMLFEKVMNRGTIDEKVADWVGSCFFSQFFTVFWNSCRQVFPIVLGHVFLGAPAAWAFARFHFRGKRILYTLYIALMLMPFQVTMVSSYLVLNKLKLIDTVWAVILPGAASTFPVFIMTRSFRAIPEAVMEAAAVDGASPFQTFLWIGIPLGASGILSSGMKD